MELEFNDLVIEADPEKTKLLYAGAERITDGCDCGGCRNYALAAERFPPEVSEFFSRMGIDPEKPAEVYLLDRKDADTARYGGFYHLCGRIINGDDDLNEKLEDATSDFYPIAEGYYVAFTESISLPEEDVPLPALQMEIDFTLPRLLE